MCHATHVAATKSELGCCLVPTDVSHAIDYGCHRFGGSCLVLVKVVAANATPYTKPRQSCGAKSHRLRFGVVIVAEWRATVKKEKATVAPHMQW